MALRLSDRRPLLGIQTQQLVDQVLCVGVNILWKLQLPLLDLVSRLCLLRSSKRRLAGEQLKHEHPHGPTIDGFIVPGPLDHFRSQIVQRTAKSCGSGSGLDGLGVAKITKLDAVVAVQQNVLRLEISVDDLRILAVQILQSLQRFVDIPCRLLVPQTFHFPQSGEQFATTGVFQPEVDVLFVLKMEQQLDDVCMLQLIHDADLGNDLVEQLVLHQVLLRHLLESIQLASLSVPHFRHLAEEPLAQDIQGLEALQHGGAFAGC
mmetsp:Transcript_41808/g.100390  ORF Transcript_41808/g.100390 Transcript_41808/m.100390 type:complete len:263 (-) Transcript_41808:47-835(-)